MKSPKSLVTNLSAYILFAGIVAGQTPPRAHITQAIDESNSVTINGNTHPAVRSAAASEVADDATPMEHMILYLKSDTTTEAQLEQLIAQQNDPGSPLYHQYLSPKDYGAQYGAAQSDVATVTTWLQQQGFTVEETPAGNRTIVFTGTAGQVASAFKTEIRKYNVNGVTHYANASDPQIPAALADVVGGIVKLHDFRHGHSLTPSKSVSAAELAHPAFTSGSSHYLAPADYGTIYDINPLYSAGINGSGQTIAVIARSNITQSDVTTFRSNFGLKANNPTYIITNTNPGVVNGDSVETTLDTEWSGAVAPSATIKVIISASTSSADGIDLSNLYAVNNNVAPIITLSYGSCEAGMGSSELAFYNNLWKQAAAQGQTVLVSSGDSGTAACDYGSTAYYGQAVNGLCSSPYSTCVGGTEFADTANAGQYWQPGNNSTYGSAISYIPEAVWNESGTVSGGSGLWSGGGGASITYAKPSWQTGNGVPADGKRDVPDVSMAAAGHDGYLIWLSGALNSVGGTSAAAPSFAGIMALVDQKTNARQGLANTTLYPLATSHPTAFHDITTGNNSVPGQTGFSATAGYDRASGLGTVDANVLVNNWGGTSSTTASITMSASATSVTVLQGKTGASTITSTATGLTAAVTLSVTGAPAGITATLASTSIAAPGSGSVALNIAATSTVAPGTYPLAIKAVSGTTTASVTVSVVVPAPTFTISPATVSLTAVSGTSVQANVAAVPANGFSSTITLSAVGLPTGITAAFSPNTLAGGTGTSTVVFAVAKTVAAGAHTFTISATGGGVTQTASVTLNVQATASCTLVANPTSVSVAQGQTAGSQITCGSVQGTFSAPLALTLTGAPTGLTARLAASSMTAGATTTLGISAATTLAAGTYNLSLTAASGGFTQTISVPVIVASPSFILTTNASSVAANIGGKAQLTVMATPQNGFNSAIAFSISTLPTGVTAAFAANTSASTGISSALMLTVSSTAKAGSYPLTITGTGGGVTKTVAFTLVVAQAGCTLAVSPASLSISSTKAGNAALTCTGTSTSSLILSVSGMPSGMMLIAGAPTVTPGTTNPLTFSVLPVTAAGNYNVALTVSGSSFAQTVTLPIAVAASNTFSISAAQNVISVKSGASGQVTLVTQHSGSFNSALSLTVSGLPTGVTASLSKASIAAPGDGTSVATFTIGSTAKAGAYSITITATGGGITQTQNVDLTIGSGPGFTLSLSAPSVTIARGSTGTLVSTVANFTNGFNGQFKILFGAVPAGMTLELTGTSPATGGVNLDWLFPISATALPGTYPVTITIVGTSGNAATGDGAQQSATFNVVIK